MSSVQPPSDDSLVKAMIQDTTKEIRKLEGAPNTQDTTSSIDSVALGNILPIIEELELLLMQATDNVGFRTQASSPIIKGVMGGLVNLDKDWQNLLADPNATTSQAFVKQYNEISSWASTDKSTNPAWKYIQEAGAEYGIPESQQTTDFQKVAAFGKNIVDQLNTSLNNNLDPLIQAQGGMGSGVTAVGILTQDPPSIQNSIFQELSAQINFANQNPMADGSGSIMQYNANLVGTFGDLISKTPSLMSNNLVNYDKLEEGKMQSMVSASQGVMSVTAQAGKSTVANTPGAGGS